MIIIGNFKPSAFFTEITCVGKSTGFAKKNKKNIKAFDSKSRKAKQNTLKRFTFTVFKIVLKFQ
jgi:hypothetical protein